MAYSYQRQILTIEIPAIRTTVRERTVYQSPSEINPPPISYHSRSDSNQNLLHPPPMGPPPAFEARPVIPPVVPDYEVYGAGATKESQERPVLALNPFAQRDSNA